MFTDSSCFTPVWQGGGHRSGVLAVAFHPFEPLLATASGDGTARLWSLSDGTAMATLDGHYGPVTGVAFSSDGRSLASSSTDGTVRLWDMATMEAIATLVPL